MADLPKNYDSVTMSVNAGGLIASCNRLVTAAQNISDALSAINSRLAALHLSWSGESAQVASDFEQRWNDVTTQLYGIPNVQLINELTLGELLTLDPDAEGLLNLLTGGVQAAAKNYANCEGSIQDMFNKFANSLNSASGGSGSGSDHSPVKDQPSGTPAVYHTTAVNESGL